MSVAGIAKLRCWLALSLAFVLSANAAKAEDSVSTATAPDAARAEVRLHVLDAADRKLYREIFEVQKAGEWKKADALIAQLSDPILMGHVQFQRYMHPTDYRSSFSELRGWMAKYADLPGATRIYRLARRRQGNARAPQRPVPIRPTYSSATTPRSVTVSSHSRAERRAIASVRSRIDREIRRRNPERAEKYLWAFERRQLLTDLEFDRELSDISTAYLIAGDAEKAMKLASYAAERSRAEISQADWVAGLAAWRLSDCDTAYKHFSAVSASAIAGAWLGSGGGFWAARAALACHRPELTGEHLRRAAKEKETFYGLLAARLLGIEPEFDWSLPKLTPEEYAKVENNPGIRRGIALAEAGQYALADEELRIAWVRGGEKIRRPVQAVAARLDLPATQLLTARAAGPDEPQPESVLYPIPLFEPDGGFVVDRALVFGMMRQESHFRPRVRSGPGAIGLMQIMPATASFLTRDRSLRSSRRSKLYEPGLNMKLGQLYIQEVMNYDFTDGNLVKFITAYNGGPGNLQRWDRMMGYETDPLMFIESVPARETRIHLEKVLANIWIYRKRMGQDTPSLEALASGAWPPYEPLDPAVISIAATLTTQIADGGD